MIELTLSCNKWEKQGHLYSHAWTPRTRIIPKYGTSQCLERVYIKSHSIHWDAPISEYFPEGQVVHSIAPDSEYVLTGQDAPIPNWPAGRGSHEVDPISWLEVRPLGHASQSIDMFVEVYLPFWQSIHLWLAVVDENVPGSQGRHECDRWAKENHPAGHASHIVAPVSGA